MNTQKTWYDNAVAVLHWLAILGGGLTTLSSYFATIPGLPPAVMQVTGGVVVAVGVLSYGLHSALAYRAELAAGATTAAAQLSAAAATTLPSSAPPIPTFPPPQPQMPPTSPPPTGTSTGP